ncbi:kelch repeat-containing protein [Chitinolyticbacter meiyuanensis]|uniref:kelch repeat-containing protein n=1 Tax=Chitinolyticbacter meiyuanensis TaxID=682798 RepID=UPI0011E6068E|nr:kelch repeat-containing protein [Chitinolyticbacter meiyuanensis]
MGLGLLLGITLSQAAADLEPLQQGRFRHGSVTLADGKVLVVGGEILPGAEVVVTQTTELFNAETRQFQFVAPMHTGRAGHATVRLQDGRVLAVGGYNATGARPPGLTTAEIYDPVTNQWNQIPLQIGRAEPKATLLPSGKVLIVGGSASTLSTELFDPQTNSFSDAGNLPQGLEDFALVALPDGRALLAGGATSAGVTVNSTLLWDPMQGGWRSNATLAQPRRYATATLLANGKVLVAGGQCTDCDFAAELFDPATGAFSNTGPTQSSHYINETVLLADGRVLLSGGSSRAIELYDPTSNTWALAGQLIRSQPNSRLALLGDGQTVILSGSSFRAGVGAVEWFNPACAVVPNAISPIQQAFPIQGGTGIVNINLPAQCLWSPSWLPTWITTSTTQGSGSGPLHFNVAPFTPASAGETRSATLLLNDVSVNITQSSTTPTSVTLSPTSQTFNVNGGSGALSISATAGMAWSVSSLPTWVQVQGNANGSGNGQLFFTVAANPGAMRSGNIVINGRIFALTQSSATPECDNPALSPSSTAVSSGGGSATTTLTTGANCSWVVADLPSWVTITSGNTGLGGSQLRFGIAANPGVARSAVLNIAGRSFVISQYANQAALCANTTFAPNEQTVGANATSSPFSFTVNTTSGCQWSITGKPYWLRWDSSSTGSASATVRYTPAVNYGAARSSILSFGSTKITINQQGSPLPINCKPITIPPNQTVLGKLETSDCTASYRGGNYVSDRYLFRGTPGMRFAVVVKGDFDSYVSLFDPYGKFSGSNDNVGPGSTDSRLPPSGYIQLVSGNDGDYLIEVTAAQPAGFGNYTLQLIQ